MNRIPTLAALFFCLSLAITQSAKATTAPSPWAPYKSYRTGDRVTYSSNVYKAIQSHTSIPGWEPPQVPALWNREASSSPFRQWAPQTPYALGSQVFYLGVPYRCVQAHTSLSNWNPLITPA